MTTAIGVVARSVPVARGGHDARKRGRAAADVILKPLTEIFTPCLHPLTRQIPQQACMASTYFGLAVFGRGVVHSMLSPCIRRSLHNIMIAGPAIYFPGIAGRSLCATGNPVRLWNAFATRVSRGAGHSRATRHPGGGSSSFCCNKCIECPCIYCPLAPRIRWVAFGQLINTILTLVLSSLQCAAKNSCFLG